MVKKALGIFFVFSLVLCIYCLGLLYFSGFVDTYDSYFSLKVNSKNLKAEVQFSSKRPRGWVRLSSMSKGLKWPIILSEDWAFYQHTGIDLGQLSIVIQESLQEGKLTRGASTITQQVVKNLYLSSSRSLFRKFHEMILAFAMESLVHKNRIHEQYFNSIG